MDLKDQDQHKFVKKVFCTGSTKYSKMPRRHLNDSEYEEYGDQDYSDLEKFESGEGG